MYDIFLFSKTYPFRQSAAAQARDATSRSQPEYLLLLYRTTTPYTPRQLPHPNHAKYPHLTSVSSSMA